MKDSPTVSLKCLVVLTGPDTTGVTVSYSVPTFTHTSPPHKHTQIHFKHTTLLMYLSHLYALSCVTSGSTQSCYPVFSLLLLPHISSAPPRLEILFRCTVWDRPHRIAEAHNDGASQSRPPEVHSLIEHSLIRFHCNCWF